MDMNATQSTLGQEPYLQSTNAATISAIVVVPSYYFNHYSRILQEAKPFEEPQTLLQILLPMIKKLLPMQLHTAPGS